MIQLVIKIIILSLGFAGITELYGRAQLKVADFKSVKKRDAVWTLVLIGFMPLVFLPLWPLLISAKEVAEAKTIRLLVLLISYLPVVASGVYIFATRYSKKLGQIGFYDRKW